MSQRTYLIRSSLTNTEVLAEAGNLLPFFWLTLIRVDDLNAKVPEMRKAAQLSADEEAYEKYQEQFPGAANIRVAGKEALSNAQAFVPFIDKCFPHAAELFTDFIRYLDEHLGPHDFLELDLIALADFTDMNTFIRTLKEEIADIQAHRPEKISGYFKGDVRYSLTGYAGDFEKHSPGFKSIAQVKNQQGGNVYVKQIPLDRAQLKSRRLKAIVLLLAALGITLGCGFYMAKNGVSFSFVMCALVGIACVFLSIEKLRSKTYNVK